MLFISSDRALSPPKVSVLAPYGKDLSTTGHISLVCLINNYYPDHLTVTWTIDGRSPTGDKQDGQSVRQSDGTYSTSSTLTVSSSVWEAGQNYVCQVQHENKGAPITATLQKSQCQME